MPVRAGRWRTLAAVHRWLGAAGCLLFLNWFVSGIAMIYVRMPAVTSADRLSHSNTLSADRLHVGPDEAQRIAGSLEAAGLQLRMLGDRPIYRAAGRKTVTVFADRVEVLERVSADQAAALARGYIAGDAAPGPGDLLTVPDQWTLQLRPLFPLVRGPAVLARDRRRRNGDRFRAPPARHPGAIQR